MRYYIELQFVSGVHFGSDDAGYGIEKVGGFMHSDTLFSALINGFARLEGSAYHRGRTDELIHAFEETENPPFVLTSMGFHDQRIG